MTDRVNGGVFAGEFLTGNMNFFSFATTVPVGQTNVTTPVEDLNTYQTYETLGVWTPVSVTNAFGGSTTYSTLDTYLDAFYQQVNLDNLIEVFATRANPVAISVKTFPTSINGATVVGNTSVIFSQMGYQNAISPTPTSVFGQAYSVSPTIYIVNMATEKSLLWTAGNVTGNYSGTPANNTNENGYNILSNNLLYGGVDGRIAFDNQDTQVINASSNTTTFATNSYFATANTVAPWVGIWDASGSTGNVNVMANQLFFDGGSNLA
jgi:hypothetical protein